MEPTDLEDRMAKVEANIAALQAAPLTGTVSLDDDSSLEARVVILETFVAQLKTEVEPPVANIAPEQPVA